MRFAILLLVISLYNLSLAQDMTFAVLKYNGGGDYYANPTAVPNLVEFCNKNLGMNISKDVPYVSAGDEDIVDYPFIHMTGHGNVVFSESERENLRSYLTGGGFLHIDDNYGMDPYIRPELKKLFPELELVELPSTHEIFNQSYQFPNGLPKIHEHDDNPPQAFALFYEGRMVVLYTYESDLGDGWEDPEVHNDTPEKHVEALRMGANMIQYIFMNGAM